MLEHIGSKPSKEQFKYFHYMFKKPYDLDSEQAVMKYKIYKSNLKKIKDVNEKNLGYTLGITPFADLTWEEFQAGYLSADLKSLITHHEFKHKISKTVKFNNFESDSKKSENSFKNRKFDFDTMADEIDKLDEESPSKKNVKDDNNDDVNEPFLKNDSKDWTYLWKTVKNQGACGDCWAFATVGAFEAINFLENNDRTLLSEQQLVDCDTQDKGCEGGFYFGAFDYVSKNGLMKQDNYAYQTKKGTCKYVQGDVYVNYKTLKSCTNNYDGDNNDELNCSREKIGDIIKYGPYASAMQVEQDLQHYIGGSIVPENCKDINHAVIVVQITKETIKFRNSWGDYWGQSGYGYIPTKTKAEKNMKGCGTLETAFQPREVFVVKK